MIGPRRPFAVALLVGMLLPIALTGCGKEPSQVADLAEKCSAEQLSYLLGVHPETITYVGPFDPAFALDIGATVICAGNYTTNQADAQWPQSSIAILEGGTDDQAVFDQLDSALTKQGFPPVSLSGISTHEWNDEQTRVTAGKFSDAPGLAELAHFPDDALFIQAVPLG